MREAEEVSRFLRLSVGCANALEPGGRKVSSHSLKRTCLSWASKAGLNKEVRALFVGEAHLRHLWHGGDLLRGPGPASGSGVGGAVVVCEKGHLLS